MNFIKNNKLITKVVHNGLRLYSSDSSVGIKYHGFTYYPRFPDQKDPPYEPTKLFMVKKIRPIKGTLMSERDILKKLKLDGDMTQVSVVKNTPTTNARLYKIKHLIQITPITFPDGEPSVEDANSLGATFLDEHGRMTVKKSVGEVDHSQNAPASYTANRLHGETLRRHLRLKWLHSRD